MTRPVVHRTPYVPRRDDGEVACARVGCGDGYTLHLTDNGPEFSCCEVCLCEGFLWVPPAGPVPEDRAP